ncbi:MAG: hypothetical protein QM831_27405 [Kofleriaceae bacterium]
MKALLLCFALVMGCSITHRTNDYACTTSSDCNSGRVCDNGFCVVSGSELVDAPTGTHPDAPKNNDGGQQNNCPPGCTSCNTTTKQCVIDCSASNANCDGQVTCPAGWYCDVKCDIDNSCRAGVECAGTTGCRVECSGKGSCQDVQCGTSRCDIECSGPQSCRDTIECNQSCGCDVSCTGAQSCPDGAVDCTSVACIGTSGKGCSSTSQVCHSSNCPALP